MEFPRELIETVERVFGDAGREWLPRLPEMIGECRARWGLEPGTIAPNARFNYVELTVTRRGNPVVLKIGVPHPELFTEMEALRLYRGRRAVDLIDADTTLGAILTRRLEPATMLWQLGDNEQETRIAAEIMRELPLPVPDAHHLPTFESWVERAFRFTRTEWDPEVRMPRDLLDRAEEALREIQRGSPGDVVLHGDLHHENMLLDATKGWTAIDPKGVIGPHCLEVGRFLQNQLPPGPPVRRKEVVIERLAILAEALESPRETLAASGLVDCVLSHCWTLEEANGVEPRWHLGVDLARTYVEML
jgi:streptomycin 6-kinase